MVVILIITCGGFDGIMTVLWFIDYLYHTHQYITYNISGVLL